MSDDIQKALELAHSLHDKPNAWFVELERSDVDDIRLVARALIREPVEISTLDNFVGVHKTNCSLYRCPCGGLSIRGSSFCHECGRPIQWK